MYFDDFFTRTQDSSNFDASLYCRKISSSNCHLKDRNLFEDCFSNHVDYISPNTDELTFDDTSTSRYIQRDNLSAFFINKIYSPPEIIHYKTEQPIEYEDFVKEFVEPCFDLNPKTRFTLGSNRIRYVLGNVGEGKSAFIKRMMSDLCSHKFQSDSGYQIFSVYIDMESKYHYGNEPVPLKDDFDIYLYNKIIERINDLELNFDTNELNGINPTNEPRLSLKLLISKLKENKFQLLLFVDNLDFYHYYYARYAFFDEYNKRQEKSIIENILWLRKELTSQDALGHLGLNIVVAARSYVYDDIMAYSLSTDTEIDTTQAIYLKPTSEDIVIGSRLSLLSRAIELVSENRPGASSNLIEMLSIVRFRLLGDEYSKGIPQSSPIKSIYKLGQHGHRSLVQFLSSLNISYQDNELFERFFSRQVSALYILYFNNVYKRYSQAQDHFPNIFLVDCLVMDGDQFPNAHQPHMHTYWLKYFILKYIVHNSHNGVKLDKILRIFRDLAGYDDHLVRHVVGSLCTANEFRCCEYDSMQANMPFYSRKIYPTERGKMLFRKVEGVELCFEFEYFGTIVDDKWLSYPSFAFDQIFHPSSSYAHLYSLGSEYVKSSIDSVYLKAKELLVFLRVLETAYHIEIGRLRPDLNKILIEDDLVPNFADLKKHVINSSSSLLKAFSRSKEAYEKIENIERLGRNLSKDDRYAKFFNEYFASGAKMAP